MTEETTAVSDFMLERYHLGELPPGDAEQVTRRLAVDAALRERLAVLRQSDRDLRQQYPPEALAAMVERRREPARPRAIASSVRPWRVAALTLASASLVVLLVSIPSLRPWSGSRTMPDAASGGERVKGDAALVVYRKAEAGSELLADGTAARRGDLLRVGYRSGAQPYGVILSIDGDGVVTRHLPVDGNAAVALQPGGTILLDAAYELDAAPKWERFFLVTGEAPFSVEATLEAARAAVAGHPDEAPAALRLPAGLQQTSFLLRKIP